MKSISWAKSIKSFSNYYSDHEIKLSIRRKKPLSPPNYRINNQTTIRARHRENDSATPRTKASYYPTAHGSDRRNGALRAMPINRIIDKELFLIRSANSSDNTKSSYCLMGCRRNYARHAKKRIATKIQTIRRCNYFWHCRVCDCQLYIIRHVPIFW